MTFKGDHACTDTGVNSMNIRTGGISLGKSTSFLNVISPLSKGHSRSTFFICSHKSASWFIRVMRPYLTWRWTLAPSSTFSFRFPFAEM
jgi:hypothetical protein